MSATFDYTGVPVTVTITNVINPEAYKACDAGTPVKKVEKKFKNIKNDPCVKFDYIFKEDGTFKKDLEGDYVVLVYEKYKTTDRKVPAYRTMNAKTLKAGESMSFVTSNKDELVFYEKVGVAFAGELKVEFANS